MIGERLKQLRLEKNMHKTEIAKALNITAQSYGLYENEKRSPDYTTLKQIADYFGVSMSYLLGETNERTLPIKADSDSSSTIFCHKVDGYDDLDPEGQKKVLEYIELLKFKFMRK